MPNHQDAIKRMRQNEKRRQYNKAYRTRARTTVKQARSAIEKGNVEEAEKATRLAVKTLDKVASKGVIHERKAARKKSRLMSQLAALKQKKQ